MSEYISSGGSNYYPEDFFVKALRNYRRPSPGLIRKMLAGRAQYLEMKAKDFAEQGRPTGMFIDELRSIVEVIEVFEEAYPLTDAQALTFRERYEIPPWSPERPPTTEGMRRYPVRETDGNRAPDPQRQDVDGNKA